MNYLLSGLLLLMLAVNFVFLAFLVSQKDLRRLQYLVVICVALSFYILGYLLEVNASTVESATMALIVSNMGIPALPVFSLLAIIQICDYKFFRKWMGVVAIVHSFLLFSIVLTNNFHKLFYTSIEVSFNQWTQLTLGHGPFYIYNQFIAFLCAFLSYILLGKRFSEWSPYMRSMMVFIIIGSSFALISNILNVFEVFSNRLDITPFAYFITLIFYFLAVIRNRIYDLVPLATERAISTMDDAFIILDQDCYFLFANQSAIDIFPEFSTMPVSTGLERVENWPFPQDSIASGNHLFTIKAADGEKIYRAGVSVVNDGNNGLGWSILIRDNTESVRLLESMERMALTDSLTGIYNRRHFEELALREISVAERSQTTLAFIMFDLDRFKRINDTYGHLAGDKVLTVISETVLARLRPGDIFARYGGEEFIILAPNTDKIGAIAFANRLRLIIAETPVSYEDEIIIMKASFGVTEWAVGNSLHATISAADDAMYAAKTAGRNRVKFKPTTMG